jgi:hypothetical protein
LRAGDNCAEKLVMCVLSSFVTTFFADMDYTQAILVESEADSFPFEGSGIGN